MQETSEKHEQLITYDIDLQSSRLNLQWRTYVLFTNNNYNL